MGTFILEDEVMMFRGETAKLTKVDCYLDASKSTFDHVTYFAKLKKKQ